jgi:twitching motility protein PilT
MNEQHPATAPAAGSDPAPSSAGQPAAARVPAPRPVDIIQVLTTAVQKGGSDVVFTVGSKPRIRIGGKLRTYGDEVLTPEVTKRMLFSLLTDDQKAHFEEHWEIDLAVNIRNVGRFRLNGFRQRGHVGAALRSIPTKLPTVQQLELPQAVVDIADSPRGLVLVTGPTGSGKSTLLAALINKINGDRECHIITIEDPIEFVHPHLKAVVEQREVGTDTKSFGNALKYVLRQNPDVILVGEMRDPETIQAAITLAETGHLVFSTLHTQNCAQTMDRIIDAFPHEAQNQVRSQLSLTLKAVVTQSLLPVPDGSRCVAAREIMVVTPAIASLIREGKTHMITNSIQTGRAQGMVTMEASIEELVEKRLCDPKAGAARINALRSYTASPNKGAAAAPVADVKPTEPEPEPQSDRPLDVDDMPSAAAAGVSVAARKPRSKPAYEPDLDMPRQVPVVAAAVVSLGTAIAAHLRPKLLRFPPEYALVVFALLFVVYVVRWAAARKRVQAEIRKMLEEEG